MWFARINRQKNDQIRCFMQYSQETRLKNWHHVPLNPDNPHNLLTSAIVHLNGLPATVEHTAAGVTWQDRDALCITPDDTTSAVWDFSMVVTASSTPHSTEPRPKKERNSDVTLMSTGPQV